jgi:diguanylate cyclase (GGDEF)-like protein
MFGHDKGDEFLIEVAAILNDSIRHVDAAGRWGGDEFVVILQQTELKKISEKFEEIRLEIEEIGKQYGGVTASIGISKIKPDDNLQTAYKRGDIAMYTAKAEGKNRVYILADPADEDAELSS